MDEKLFRPVMPPETAAPLLFITTVRERAHDDETDFDDPLTLHDPPRRTLEGFVNRPDW